MSADRELDIETRCIHLDLEEEAKLRDDVYGALSYPIFQSATFAHPSLGQTTGYDYTRQTNPTRSHLQKIVAKLEKGAGAVGFTSGMAAVTCLMELFSVGDHLIVEEDLYGGSVRLFDNFSKRHGISFTSLDIAHEEIEPYITDQTKAVFIESPTNPMMHVVDIENLARVCKAHDLLLIVDNTFLSPYLQNPLELGADIVIHSGTKYLGGHNDTIAGFLIAKDERLVERFAYIATSTGSSLSPFDSWMIERGIKTLSVRMDRACENAAVIANWLKEQEIVTDVYYPGFADHPGYGIMKKQARGFGAMVSFKVKNEEQAKSLLEEVRLIQFAESLGGVETLITYPLTQTHADVPEALRQKNGLDGRLLRLSVGIESKKDLIEDLENAFAKVSVSCHL